MLDRRSYLRTRIAELNFPENARERVPIRIAGVRIDFVTDDAVLASEARAYFFEHLDPVTPPQAEVFARPLPGPAGLWEDDDAEFEISGEQVIQRDFVARECREPPSKIRRCVAWVAPHLDDALHNLLRWFSPPILLANGAFLLHGAGVVRDARGYVFFGQSGAGKSTSAALISESDPRATVLGDDGIIVAMDGEKPFIHAAPLGCGYSRLAPPPIRAPLAGLFALHQDRADAIEPLSTAEGMAALLASAMTIRPDDSPEERFDLAFRFARSACGIRRLRFRRSAAFWNQLILKNEVNHVQAEQHPFV